jgi:hypothetical protein
MSKASLEILNILGTYLKANPDIRFGQALVNVNIIGIKVKESKIEVEDPYYVDDEDILKKIKEGIQK